MPTKLMGYRTVLYDQEAAAHDQSSVTIAMSINTAAVVTYHFTHVLSLLAMVPDQ